MGIRAAILALALTACGGANTQSPKSHAYDGPHADPPRAGATAPRPAVATFPAVELTTPMPSFAPIKRKRRWRGRKIDFDVKDADLHNVFRLLADVGGVNVIVADTVPGNVTMRLRQVPWEQVIHAVAKVKRLSLEYEDGIYFIMRK